MYNPLAFLRRPLPNRMIVVSLRCHNSRSLSNSQKRRACAYGAYHQGRCLKLKTLPCIRINPPLLVASSVERARFLARKKFFARRGKIFFFPFHLSCDRVFYFVLCKIFFFLSYYPAVLICSLSSLFFAFAGKYGHCRQIAFICICWKRLQTTARAATIAVKSNSIMRFPRYKGH